MTEPNRNGDVWVFAEQEEGKLSEVPLELMGKARELAGELGACVTAVLAGADVSKLAPELVAHGADKVLIAEDPALSTYQTASYSKVLCDLIAQNSPQIVLYGATPLGRDLAPTVASRMKCGLTADCTDLQIGDHTDPISKVDHKNLLFQIRPAFGGNIIATIVNPERWPQMATVREGVMPLTERDDARQGEIVSCDVSLDGTPLPLVIDETYRGRKKVNLKAARVIVAGGAGVGSAENFNMLWELAGLLGGAVGASRAAVDLGYVDHDHQIGQTGTTVRPALYIAVGLSGAVQHRAGMQESAKILAINTDPDADIFKVAHYGIVGDYEDVIPKMVKAIHGGS